MRNPFRSEAEAYRLVWLTIGYFVLIVAGSLINVWLGFILYLVAVFTLPVEILYAQSELNRLWRTTPMRPAADAAA